MTPKQKETRLTELREAIQLHRERKRKQLQDAAAEEQIICRLQSDRAMIVSGKVGQ